MSDYGEYTPQTEVARFGVESYWTAKNAAGDAFLLHIVRTPPHWEDRRRADTLALFEKRLQAHQHIAASCGKWASIIYHHVATDFAYVAIQGSHRSLQQLIASKTIPSTSELGDLLLGVFDALANLQRKFRRPHGHLAARRILLSGTTGGYANIMLYEPALAEELPLDAPPALDLHALAHLLFELFHGRPYSDAIGLGDAASWETIPEGNQWREYCDFLLAAGPDVTLESARKRIPGASLASTVTRIGKRQKFLVAALIVTVIGAAVWYATRAKPAPPFPAEQVKALRASEIWLTEFADLAAKTLDREKAFSPNDADYLANLDIIARQKSALYPPNIPAELNAARTINNAILHISETNVSYTRDLSEAMQKFKNDTNSLMFSNNRLKTAINDSTAVGPVDDELQRLNDMSDFLRRSAVIHRLRARLEEAKLEQIEGKTSGCTKLTVANLRRYLGVTVAKSLEGSRYDDKLSVFDVNLAQLRALGNTSDIQWKAVDEDFPDLPSANFSWEDVLRIKNNLTKYKPPNSPDDESAVAAQAATKLQDNIQSLLKEIDSHRQELANAQQSGTNEAVQTTVNVLTANLEKIRERVKNLSTAAKTQGSISLEFHGDTKIRFWIKRDLEVFHQEYVEVSKSCELSKTTLASALGGDFKEWYTRYHPDSTSDEVKKLLEGAEELRTAYTSFFQTAVGGKEFPQPSSSAEISQLVNRLTKDQDTIKNEFIKYSEIVMTARDTIKELKVGLLPPKNAASQDVVTEVRKHLYSRLAGVIKRGITELGKSRTPLNEQSEFAAFRRAVKAIPNLIVQLEFTKKTLGDANIPADPSFDPDVAILNSDSSLAELIKNSEPFVSLKLLYTLRDEKDVNNLPKLAEGKCRSLFVASSPFAPAAFSLLWLKLEKMQTYDASLVAFELTLAGQIANLESQTQTKLPDADLAKRRARWIARLDMAPTEKDFTTIATGELAAAFDKDFSKRLGSSSPTEPALSPIWSDFSPRTRANFLLTRLNSKLSPNDLKQVRKVLTEILRKELPASASAGRKVKEVIDATDEKNIAANTSLSSDSGKLGPEKVGWKKTPKTGRGVELLSFQSPPTSNEEKDKRQPLELVFAPVETKAGRAYICITEAPIALLRYELNRKQGASIVARNVNNYLAGTAGDVPCGWNDNSDAADPEIELLNTWSVHSKGDNVFWVAGGGNASKEQLKDVGGDPGPLMPLQRVSVPIALYVSALVGCRLQTVDEWNKALEDSRMPSLVTPLSAQILNTWGLNVADARWKHQFVFTSKDGSLPAYTNEIFWGGAYPTSASPVHSEPTTSADDQTPLFRPVNASIASKPASDYYHLIGNVAEYAVSDRYDIDSVLGPSAKFQKDSLKLIEHKLYVIGGSALAPLPPGDLSKPIPLRFVFNPNPKSNITVFQNGFADVGFRLAFDAPMASTADKIAGILAKLPRFIPPEPAK